MWLVKIKETRLTGKSTRRRDCGLGGVLFHHHLAQRHDVSSGFPGLVAVNVHADITGRPRRLAGKVQVAPVDGGLGRRDRRSADCILEDVGVQSCPDHGRCQTVSCGFTPNPSKKQIGEYVKDLYFPSW